MDGKSAPNTRSRSTRDLTPCLPDTTTGGATGAGNETTETKAGTGTETEAAMLAAGATPAPAPAAQDGLAQTRRDDQACATHQSTPYFLSHKRAPPQIADTDRRDYGRDRDEDRRDRDPRDSRRRDDRERRDATRRDGDKGRDRQDREKREGEKGKDAEPEPERVGERVARVNSESRETGKPSQSHGASRFVLIP